jgi:hypothetical protein
MKKKSHSKKTLERMYPAEKVINIMNLIEKKHFGNGGAGVRARNRRLARMLAALTEYTDLTVTEAGRTLGMCKDRAFNMQKKWNGMPDEEKDSYMAYLDSKLEA